MSNINALRTVPHQSTLSPSHYIEHTKERHIQLIINRIKSLLSEIKNGTLSLKAAREKLNDILALVAEYGLENDTVIMGYIDDILLAIEGIYNIVLNISDTSDIMVTYLEDKTLNELKDLQSLMKDSPIFLYKDPSILETPFFEKNADYSKEYQENQEQIKFAIMVQSSIKNRLHIQMPIDLTGMVLSQLFIINSGRKLKKTNNDKTSQSDYFVLDKIV
ncbi:MAG: hypothetical protein HRT90_04620 [Candidatus Margulisbacteria bacterium]|nr:hypothetical protein [Candidatus Margulisiibacteriota bacterium]